MEGIRILVAIEESRAATEQFMKLGFEVSSCPCSETFVREMHWDGRIFETVCRDCGEVLAYGFYP